VIIFPLILQTIIIAQMMFTEGERVRLLMITVVIAMTTAADDAVYLQPSL